MFRLHTQVTWPVGRQQVNGSLGRRSYPTVVGETSVFRLTQHRTQRKRGCPTWICWSTRTAVTQTQQNCTRPKFCKEGIHKTKTVIDRLENNIIGSEGINLSSRHEGFCQVGASTPHPTTTTITHVQIDNQTETEVQRRTSASGFE